ncbi:MAG: acetate--CoA ligase [Actinomycetota bacterium]
MATRTVSGHWDAVWDELDGDPDGEVNIAAEVMDRHVARGRGDHVALRWSGRRGDRVELTYEELLNACCRFAGVLRSLGARRGDRVFALCTRVPELYVGALATLRIGAVFSPLFSAFGPLPIIERMTIGEGRFLLTTAPLFRRKVAPILDDLPGLDHVLVLGDVGDLRHERVQVHDLRALLAEATPDTEPEPTHAEELALLHFTSGTTGTPKGAMHVHAAIAAHLNSARQALDLCPDDVFWCTADPGWVTGTSYGILGPLAVGCTMVVDEAEFDAARWYGILADERVTVWYTAPTAIRRLMRVGDGAREARALDTVRFVASVGEPLNPEAVVWGREHLGLTIHDNWWQTETGAIMIANRADAAVKPGSMGRPIDGIAAGVLRRDERGAIVLDDHDRPTECGIDEIGELAIRGSWPSRFRGYLGQEERYRACFVDDWYRSGDLARRDVDGYFWFVGRGDDLIKSAGHLIGPFEVESALIEHPAVAEAGVIGVPDETMGEVVKAFVSLAPGHDFDDALRRELMAHARRRLGPAVAPREIEHRTDLPTTRSGKIMRRVLRARELGLPEGDLSTMEGAEGATGGLR